MMSESVRGAAVPAFNMCSAPYQAGMSVRQSRTRQSPCELELPLYRKARPSDQFAQWQPGENAETLKAESRKLKS
jgi:hypothetical protein